MKRIHIFYSLLVILVFLIVDSFDTYLLSIKSILPDNYYLRVSVWVIIKLIPPAILLTLWHGPKKIIQCIGLQSGFSMALFLSFLFALPMFLGYGGYAQFEISASYEKIFWGILLAPIFEEVFFRGFLFGQLYRYAGWGFVPAALLNAVIFGAMHLYQAQDLAGAFGVMGVTTMGGVFFAWLYKEWNFNLWVPTFLHLFMNAWWILFGIGATAAGGWYANVFRIMTIAAAVIVTIWWKRHSKTQDIPAIELT